MSQKLQFPVRIPFVEELGLELWAYHGGTSEVRVDLAEAHLNSWEVAHGGVLMTMLDVAMATAARSVHSKDPGHGPGVVTVEMKTSFMRAAEGELRALAQLLPPRTNKSGPRRWSRAGAAAAQAIAWVGGQGNGRLDGATA